MAAAIPLRALCVQQRNVDEYRDHAQPVAGRRGMIVGAPSTSFFASIRSAVRALLARIPFDLKDKITRVGLAFRVPRQRRLEAQPFVEAMRSRQDFIARQAYLIVSRAAGELDQLLRDGTADSMTSKGRGNEHACHFTPSAIKILYRARADDLRFDDRAQENRLMPVNGFRLVDVRQPRINEIAHEGVGVATKVLAPDGLDELSSLRRVAMLEWPDDQT
jgi:hypothetical protein